MSTPGGIMNSEPPIAVPTLLITNNERGSDRMVESLQSQGYFVLLARDAADALNIVRIHSRPIHLLLTDGSREGRTLASTATKYRPKMSVLFVSGGCEPEDEGSFSVEEALRTISELVTPPQHSRPALRAQAAGGYS